MFESIAVGYDGSACADAAVVTAVDLVRGGGGRVTVLAVIPTAPGAKEGLVGHDGEARRISQSAERHRGLVESAGIGYRVEVLAGAEPADTIKSVVDRGGFDVLVVGRHGRSRPVRGGLGWVAHQLVSDVACPVLVAGSSQHAPPNGEARATRFE